MGENVIDIIKSWKKLQGTKGKWYKQKRYKITLVDTEYYVFIVAATEKKRWREKKMLCDQQWRGKSDITVLPEKEKRKKKCEGKKKKCCAINNEQSLETKREKKKRWREKTVIKEKAKCIFFTLQRWKNKNEKKVTHTFFFSISHKRETKWGKKIKKRHLEQKTERKIKKESWD